MVFRSFLCSYDLLQVVFFSTDACLTSCGGMSAGEFFHVEFPPSVLARFRLFTCWRP